MRNVTAVENEIWADPLDLVIVMPVYNEFDCIAPVIFSWRRVLDTMDLRYRLIVLDDGSTDGTSDVLRELMREGAIQLIEKENTGHGPTVLRGYRLASTMGTWVFQCDSDGEMDPADFARVWAIREEFDMVVGVRRQLTRNALRRAMSKGSTLLVGALFGNRVRDVNAPFRLIGADWLGKMLEVIPHDSFAPNVMLSGLANRWKLRVHNEPLNNISRKTGRSLRREVRVMCGLLAVVRDLLRLLARSSNAF